MCCNLSSTVPPRDADMGRMAIELDCEGCHCVCIDMVPGCVIALGCAMDGVMDCAMGCAIDGPGCGVCAIAGTIGRPNAGDAASTSSISWGAGILFAACSAPAFGSAAAAPVKEKTLTDCLCSSASGG
mmetsp:Transcript_12454/g.29624  ORF Transcript_12454/g.29624 Transcript_12454/m.29624 type:complete len:128 (+) Transcript_12454:1060-1443(+)